MTDAERSAGRMGYPWPNPDHEEIRRLRAELEQVRHYFSTYCYHKIHAECRQTCKACGAPCRCSCHQELSVPGTSPRPDPAEMEQAPGCGCFNCDVAARGHRMFVCPACGNKRCPHAAWHGYLCTNSNEMGQIGVTAP